jgi:hypothetical protein
MRDYIIQQLRDRSCVKGKQRTWVSDLSDDQLYELFLRLRSGENAKTIARYIRGAWGVNPETTVHSISQGILKFKKRIALLLISPTTEEGDGYPGPHSCGFNPEDTLASLDYIARIQRDRIISMIEMEKESGVKHPYLNRDLQALATLQKVILKQKSFEMLHDDPLKQKRWAQRERGVQKQFDIMMKQIGDDERIKMAGALGKFLEWADQNAIRGEIGLDGKIRAIKSCDKIL